VAALCITAVLRATRPKRTGALEALRFLCVLLVVLLLWKPEWRVVTLPESKPEVAILIDASRSMTTNDAILPDILKEKDAVVSRDQWVKKVLSSDFVSPLKKNASNRVFEQSFSALPKNPDPSTLALSGTNIYSAIDDLLEEHDNLRAVILLSDGDWNVGSPPVVAAQKMRNRHIPLFAIPVGSDRRLPDLDVSNVTAPTYGIVGENIQIPFTIISSLDRDVRTIVRLKGVVPLIVSSSKFMDQL